MKPSLFTLAALAFAGLATVPAFADTATDPMDLGTFNGFNFSSAYSVSADGSAVVGTTDNGAYNQANAFLWSPSTGKTNLGTLGGVWANAYGVSADGSVVVGISSFDSNNSTWHAFRWTRTTGMVDIVSSFPADQVTAMAVSADGSTIVGWFHYSTASPYYWHAFLWTQATGIVELGSLYERNSFAHAVSGDGSIVVGQVLNLSGDWRAFRWTQATGMVDIGTLGGTKVYYSTDRGMDISDDGSTIVGGSYIGGDSAYHAYRWTQVTGMADLGTLGGTNSEAFSTSGDGSIIVGKSYIVGNSTLRAFRWTQATGMQDLNTLLAEAGVNMSGITLTLARGISANGQYIVGQGDFPDATQRAFLVCYDLDSGCVGLTTGEAQASSADKLAEDRRAAMIESRAAAYELLGMTQPMEQRSFVRAGALFGSAMAYLAGQASLGGLTALGGLGYGRQDYDNVAPSDALTVAAALRYTFADPFGDRRQALHPFAELGGWATPEETLTFTRDYANGSGSNSGSGSAPASAFAGYARGGLLWDATKDDRLAGYGEFGRQYLSVGSYVEASGARRGNPFPAAVDGGLFWMNIARAGVSWTHDMGAAFAPNGQPVPLSFTLAGAVARSFDPRNGLNATLTGAGAVATRSESDTWGEFGGRIAAQFTPNLLLGFDCSGTAGADPVGTSFHGGVSLTYRF